ncbi:MULTISPECIES: hypothetical protein [Nocardioides]|uniref:Allene oxide cyclase barrel-like domain-containing protein n=1 Tax=Nocardioides vastitatis TaxID=2568655 RepID=A0ABW0ZNM0_9ACTN|nr:hypothetical protein [Nocardioides sp.]THJ11544.1 hypothetical protein E7Z54_02140 [Nocardioides sp.]
MEQSRKHHPSPARRTVLVGGLAATAGLAVSSPARATEGGGSMTTTQILAGMGAGVASYDPPVTAVAATVTLHSDTGFVPALVPSDAPLRALVSDSVNGTIVTSCTGALGAHNLNGLLKWADGTTSAYTIDSVEGERMNGHVLLHATGTIKNGYYAGAKVDRLESRLSDDMSTCVAGGGPVTGTTGSVVINVTLP